MTASAAPSAVRIGQGWPQWTGFHGAATAAWGQRPGTEVLVFPGAEERGRAHVALITCGGRATADVDLSGCGLRAGEGCELRNGQALLGVPVLSGACDPFTPVISVPTRSAETLAVDGPAGPVHGPASTSPTVPALVPMPATTPIPRAPTVRVERRSAWTRLSAAPDDVFARVTLPRLDPDAVLGPASPEILYPASFTRATPPPGPRIAAVSLHRPPCRAPLVNEAGCCSALGVPNPIVARKDVATIRIEAP